MPTEPYEAGVEATQAIDAFMERLAAAPVAARLPTAEMIWVKAQLLRRWDAEHKMTLAADMLEPVQIAAMLAAAAVFVFQVLPSLMHAWLPR
jgi:hypothetical protein